jgi:hypothetical protein
MQRKRLNGLDLLDAPEDVVSILWTPRRVRRRRPVGSPCKDALLDLLMLSCTAGRAAISAAQKKRWAAIKRKRAAGES